MIARDDVLYPQRGILVAVVEVAAALRFAVIRPPSGRTMTAVEHQRE